MAGFLSDEELDEPGLGRTCCCEDDELPEGRFWLGREPLPVDGAGCAGCAGFAAGREVFREGLELPVFGQVTGDDGWGLAAGRLGWLGCAGLTSASGREGAGRAGRVAALGRLGWVVTALEPPEDPPAFPVLPGRVTGRCGWVNGRSAGLAVD